MGWLRFSQRLPSHTKPPSLLFGWHKTYGCGRAEQPASHFLRRICLFHWVASTQNTFFVNLSIGRAHLAHWSPFDWLRFVGTGYCLRPYTNSSVFFSLFGCGRRRKLIKLERLMCDTHKRFARRLGIFFFAIWEFGFDSSHVGIYTLFVMPTARQQNLLLFLWCILVMSCW